MDSSRKYLLGKYNAKVLELDGGHFSHKFEVEYSGSLRSMSSDYRTDMKVLSMNLLNQHKLEYEEALHDVQKLKEFQDARESLNSTVPDDYKMFGKYFDGPGTDWEALLSSLRWAKALIDMAGTDLDGDLIKLVCDDPEGMGKVKDGLDRVRPSFDVFDGRLAGPGPVSSRGQVPDRGGSPRVCQAHHCQGFHLSTSGRQGPPEGVGGAQGRRGTGEGQRPGVHAGPGGQGHGRRRQAAADVPQAALHPVDRFLPAPCTLCSPASTAQSTTR